MSQRPTTAPAPQRVDPQTLAALIVFGGAAVAAMALLVPETWGAYYATRLWLPLWVIGCLVFGGALLQHRSRWVTRISRVSRHQLVEWGGGAYGAIALVCFLWIEYAQVRELIDWVVRTEWYTDKFGVRDILREAFRNFVSFFVDSFMNGIFAFIWPAFWGKAFTAGQMWPAAIVGWGVFESARFAVKQVARPAPPVPPAPPANPRG